MTQPGNFEPKPRAKRMPPSAVTSSAARRIDAEAYEHAAVFYALLYGMLLFLLWLWKGVTFFRGDSADQAVAVLVESMGGEGVIVTAPGFILILLIVSNIRMILGSLLCHSQTSALRHAILKRVSSDNECLTKFTVMYVLIKSIAFIALCRTYSFGSSSSIILPFILLLEATCIIFFDHLFKSEISDIDPDRYIRNNDWTFLSAAVIWFLLALWSLLPPSFFQDRMGQIAAMNSMFSSTPIDFIRIQKGIGEVFFILFVGVTCFHAWVFKKEYPSYKKDFSASWKASKVLLKDFGRFRRIS